MVATFKVGQNETPYCLGISIPYWVLATDAYITTYYCPQFFFLRFKLFTTAIACNPCVLDTTKLIRQAISRTLPFGYFSFFRMTNEAAPGD